MKATKREREPLKQFELSAVITLNVTVLIEAETEAEALDKFNRGEWVESDGERTDWHATSAPREV